MKQKLFVISVLLALFACSSEKMNFNKLQDRNGLYYLVNEDKPFSGEVIQTTNGKTDFEGEIVSGLRQGIWDYYYPSGQKKIEGNYKDGVKDGTWKYWKENGQLERTEIYKDGRLLVNEGSAVDTVADTVAAGNQATELAGSSVKSQPAGAAAKEPVKEVEKKKAPSPVVWESLHGGPVKYYNGIPYTGPVIKYFKNGNVELEGNFVAGKRSGKWTYYHPTGTVKNIKYY